MNLIPTVRLRKGSQVIVVNLEDYKRPDGVILEPYKGYELLSLDSAGNIMAETLLARETEPLPPAPETAEEIAAHVKSLPSKSAVMKYAVSKGLDLDPTSTLPDLRASVIAALCQDPADLDETSKLDDFSE